jgi:hypothetical protein
MATLEPGDVQATCRGLGGWKISVLKKIYVRDATHGAADVSGAV